MKTKKVLYTVCNIFSHHIAHTFLFIIYSITYGIHNDWIQHQFETNSLRSSSIMCLELRIVYTWHYGMLIMFTMEISLHPEDTSLSKPNDGMDFVEIRVPHSI